MRFWDSSALVPLVVRETTSAWATQILDEDPTRIAWSFSAVEVHSALNRRRREQLLSQAGFTTARKAAAALLDSFSRVMAFEQVAERAARVLDVHALRAADSLQLAAALLACREHPADLEFVTLDVKLADAAEREGFPVLMHRD